MKDQTEDFADQLGYYLVRAGLTQQELANKMGGKHRNTIGKWLRRDSRPQSRGHVLWLAEELGLSKKERKMFIQAAGFPVERWPTEVWTVPQQLDMFFTGRNDVLQSLRELLVPGSTTALTQAISGLGGIGKTHTAVEYAYHFHEYYEAVLWLQADSWEVLASACMDLSEKLLGPSEQEETDAGSDPDSAEELSQSKQKETTGHAIADVQHWLGKHRHWLLILDNVENPQEILSKFVPVRHQGSVLITTRVQDVEPLAQTLALSTMSEQEGVLFLIRRTKKIAPKAGLEQATPELYDEAKQIWQLMDGLPLALDQAGAYILETSCSFPAYREQYTHRRAELLNRRGKRFIGHEESVATTFSLAFEQIEGLNPVAADILRVCSLLYSEAIPEEFFQEGVEYLGPRHSTEKDDWDLAIGVLQDYSLVQRQTDAMTLSIHRLVQAVLIDSMDEQTQRQWAEQTVQMMNKMFPTIDVVKRQAGQRYISHAQACVELIDRWRMKHVEAARLLHETGSYFYMVAQYEQAEPLFTRALEIREQVLGYEHTDVAASLNNLALLYQAQGKYERAEPLLKRALEIVEQAGEPEDPRISKSLNNLAEVYKIEGKYEQAETLLWHALRIDEKRFGPEHLEVATDLNNLAELYRVQGRYEQAENLCLRALAIREHILEPKHAHTISSYNNLALLYHKQGKFQQAELLYMQILSIFEEAYGSKHPDLALSLSNLALLYEDLGKYEEAKLLYQRALVIFEQMLGPEHSVTSSTRDRYAALIKGMK